MFAEGVNLSQLVKSARKKKGLSQLKLALSVGVTDQAISDIETGRTVRIQSDTLEGLSHTLGIPMEEMTAAMEETAAAAAKGDQSSTSGIADEYRLTGILAVKLSTKAAMRGKRPMDFLTLLLNLPDEKLDRALPPGFRVPTEPHGGMRWAAKDRDEDEDGGGKKPKKK